MEQPSKKKRARKEADIKSEPELQADDNATNPSAGEEEEDEEYDAKELLKEERERLGGLIQMFSDEELRRYEAARRCTLRIKDIKQTMEVVLGKNARGAAKEAQSADVPSVDERTLVVLNGLTKFYLRELIETACIIADERDRSGRIQPRHLREAFRRMKAEGKIPTI